MRILYIAPGYYPHIGGVEYVVKSIAERLVKHGHEVTVIAGEPGIKSPIEEELNGVSVIRWPTLAPEGAYHIPRQRSAFTELLRRLALNSDVVHVHSAHAVITVEAGLKLKAYNPSLRLVFTPHYHGSGHTLLRRTIWDTLWRRRVDKLVKAADVVHSVSPYEALLLREHYSHVESKLVVIPNGVDEDVLNYKWRGQNSDYMIYAGRIEKYKRLELAVDLAKQLNLKLLVVGRGPHDGRLRRYAEKHYPGKVEFHPPQPREKYLELIAGSRYVVNPSKHEAYSILIAEALTIGTPALVTKTILKALQIKPTHVLKINSEELYIIQSAHFTSWETIAMNIESIYYINKKYINQ